MSASGRKRTLALVKPAARPNVRYRPIAALRYWAPQLQVQPTQVAGGLTHAQVQVDVDQARLEIAVSPNAPEVLADMLDSLRRQSS